MTLRLVGWSTEDQDETVLKCHCEFFINPASGDFIVIRCATRCVQS